MRYLDYLAYTVLFTVLVAFFWLVPRENQPVTQQLQWIVRALIASYAWFIFRGFQRGHLRRALLASSGLVILVSPFLISSSADSADLRLVIGLSAWVVGASIVRRKLPKTVVTLFLLLGILMLADMVATQPELHAFSIYLVIMIAVALAFWMAMSRYAHRKAPHPTAPSDPPPSSTPAPHPEPAHK